MGQLEDLEVISPVQRIQTGEDLDKLMEAFEDLYSMVYTHGAKHSEAGYQILEMGLISSVPKPKPVIRKYPLEGKTPPGGAGKGTKDVYTKGTWKKTRLYDLDKLLPGNEVEGPAILEAASTTMPIPEGKKVLIDEFKRYWLEEV
jgi:acetone carboxylase beta subunit